MHEHESNISAVILSASLDLFVRSMPQEKPMNYPFRHLFGKVSQLAKLRVQYIFLVNEVCFCHKVYKVEGAGMQILLKLISKILTRSPGSQAHMWRIFDQLLHVMLCQYSV